MEQKDFEKLVTKLENLNENLKTQLLCPELRKVWTSKEDFKGFMGFADTQIAAITKKYKFVTTKIGKRIFYHNESALETMKINQKK
jgi:hypothetical protein